jgi:hypothetical protein
MKGTLAYLKPVHTLALALLLFLLTGGCVAVVPSPPPREAGPPPWAPAHGYRAKYHTYYYYPSIEVYYYPTVRRYYWLEGGDWKVGTWLPRRFVIEGREKVVLNLDFEPHKRHGQIKKSYPRNYHRKGNRGKGGGWSKNKF